jgi:hypothetical protein
MARYMNDYDIEFARRRFARATCPNRLALAMVVEHLAEWTNTVSDGWAYWTKPRQAADKAMALIESTTNAANDKQERNDITDEEMLAAVRPIKALLTREKATPEWRERILRSTQEATG